MSAPYSSHVPTSESEPRRIVVDDADRAMRLDAFLAKRLGVGRRAAARWAERARVNGRRAAKSRVLEAGDVVELPAPAVARAPAGVAEPHVVCEDADLLVVAKPSGLPTVAVGGSAQPSLASWLARSHPELARVGREGESGIAHRLDNDTSGLLLVGRSARAHAELREGFRRHLIEKTYLAVVEGRLAEPIRIDAPIGQHRKSRTRVRALAPGDHPRYDVTPAETTVTPLHALPGATVVRARTRTGARHQIRVHLAHVGHPLAGDRRYGGTTAADHPSYLLHAAAVAWQPEGGPARSFELHPPDGWRAVVGRLDDLMS